MFAVTARIDGADRAPVSAPTRVDMVNLVRAALDDNHSGAVEVIDLTSECRDLSCPVTQLHTSRGFHVTNYGRVWGFDGPEFRLPEGF